MPSETRLRKLREWPMCIIVDEWDADGYAASAHSKLLRAPDGVASFPAPIGIGPNEWRDRHGRYCFKAQEGQLVREDRPLDASIRLAEIDMRVRWQFSDEQRVRAIEDKTYGDSTLADAIHAARQQIENDVDREIAAATPLRSKEDVVTEVRNRRPPI